MVSGLAACFMLRVYVFNPPVFFFISVLFAITCLSLKSFVFCVICVFVEIVPLNNLVSGFVHMNVCTNKFVTQWGLENFMVEHITNFLEHEQFSVHAQGRF